MPVIEVKMFAGRTDEQKRRLAKRITEATMEVLGVKAEAVRVIFYDVPKENWAIAGETIAEREQR
jgi:4-oxalocrotonate tautomerase